MLSFALLAGVAFVASVLLTITLFVSRQRLRNKITICERERHQAESEIKKQLQTAIFERETLVSEVFQLRSNQYSLLEHLSHELRTPLHALTNFTSFLKEDLASGDVASASQQICRIESHLDKFNRMIEQLGVVSKLNQEVAVKKMTPVSLSLLVQLKIDEFQTLSRQRGITFEFQELDREVWVRGDDSDLNTLLNNLFENAIQVCQAGNQVKIRLNPLPNNVMLTIADDGMGIHADDVKKLFAPFIKTHNSIKANFDGSGLGLYLCKRITEQHGGKISIHSEGIGKGARIDVELPRMNSVPTEIQA